MHLMLCPDEDRTRLLIESVNKLTEWMARDNNTDPEILHWIPKYILMRGVKPLSDLGIMLPQLKALACSQDLIGWRDFTEGYISTHFTRYSPSISRCQVVSSMERTGLSNSYPSCSKSHTLNESIAMSLSSMTDAKAICTRRVQKKSRGK
jgi:hypothetical protein